MVLGYGGFFGLSSRDYRAVLMTRSNQELQKQEIVKTRRIVSNPFAIGMSVAAAFFSGGGTLPITAEYYRRLVVADRKLIMIKKELASRGVPLHDFEMKDVLIPAAGCIVGLGVGLGIDEQISGLFGTGVTTIGAADIQLSAMHVSQVDQVVAEVAHPGDAFHGLQEGFMGQTHEVSAVAQMHLHGIENTINAPSASELLSGQSFTLVHGGVAEHAAQLGGIHMGEHAARELETFSSSQISVWIMEKLEEPDWYRKGRRVGCTRTRGMRQAPLSCVECNGAITSGQYKRECETEYPRIKVATTDIFATDCYACRSDSYDICMTCYEKGARCSCGSESSTGLHNLHVAYNGNFRTHQERRRDILRTRRCQALYCDRCERKITQGRVFRKLPQLGISPR